MSGLDGALRLRCGVELPNRIALAPMTNTQSHPDGTLGEDERRWLEARAAGGFGLVSTCAAYVSEEGKAWAGQLGVAEDQHLDGLTRLATSLDRHGAVSICQLHHGGAKADLAPERRLSTVDDDPDGPRGATLEDIARVIGDEVAAARRAEAAGFAGVELHGANGYLFTQFLAPLDNPRTDAYGGDIAGRARFLREALRAVRSAVSPGFAVGVRISPVDLWQTRGLILEDSLQVGRWLAEDGADFVHLSLGNAGGPAPSDPEGPPVVGAFRDALPDDVALISAGGVWTRDDAQRALDAGADAVAIAKAAIIHPDWPRVSAREGWEPTRPPWTEAQLREAAVGDAFLAYLERFRGLRA